MMYRGKCPQCGKHGGEMLRLTYLGAPDGGVPVHRDCVEAFFEEISRPFSKLVYELKQLDE